MLYAVVPTLAMFGIFVPSFAFFFPVVPKLVPSLAQFFLFLHFLSLFFLFVPIFAKSRALRNKKKKMAFLNEGRTGIVSPQYSRPALSNAEGGCLFAFGSTLEAKP